MDPFRAATVAIPMPVEVTTPSDDTVTISGLEVKYSVPVLELVISLTVPSAKLPITVKLKLSPMAKRIGSRGTRVIDSKTAGGVAW
jgi:hypothetical protein